jgi:hypothetical protein
MGTALSEQEFIRRVRSFERSAFHMETRRSYALGYEREDYEQFCVGNPTPPSELDWWRPWLDRVKSYAAEGKQVGRVRLVDTPPTDYQRWLLWANPWHEAAGEDIRYLPRAQAEQIALPMHDWWLLDDAYLITMDFTDSGEIAGKSLIIDQSIVTDYMSWRDRARRYAVSAQQIVIAV